MSSRYAAGTTDVRIREWRRSRNLVFCEYARMRARPAGPAQSSALHDFARSGPTKEAHPRASIGQTDFLVAKWGGRATARSPTKGMTARCRYAASNAGNTL